MVTNSVAEGETDNVADDNVNCHLQSFLAWRCIAIWPGFCNDICHISTVAYPMISA